MECQLLQQQLNDEKEYQNQQLELAQQQVNCAQQRNREIQKQLSEDNKMRVKQYQQLENKQFEITKQLEANGKEQAARILHLENENQSLQNTLNAMKEQIEGLNIQEYKQLIDKQKMQLEDNNKYITKLKEEIEIVNINNLQDKQIEKVLNLLKKVTE
ncbi:Hypothetical_protein [Hexamita inflata]|uniref:Hypothetical_protein n=1 Tax=Hexamita inflata TaxID=28002 RepID=A0AA86N9V8_9EUKA|nr:Hypothetical protein HINF_LOCUS2719 [Hexamita inflata]